MNSSAPFTRFARPGTNAGRNRPHSRWAFNSACKCCSRRTSWPKGRAALDGRSLRYNVGGPNSAGGYLGTQSADDDYKNLTVPFQYLWAENQYDRLKALAADLVRRRVALIVANETPAVLAAKAATTTIPIVFNTAGDPRRAAFGPPAPVAAGESSTMRSLRSPYAPRLSGCISPTPCGSIGDAS